MRKKKISERDIGATIAGFYSVLIGGATWNESLMPLLKLFQISFVHLLEFDTLKKRPNALGAISVRSESEVIADISAYNDYYQKIDARTAHTINDRVGKVTTCREYCSDHFVSKNEVYQDFLIPREGEFLMGAKIAQKNDGVAMIGIFRGGGQQRYSTTEIAHFQPLVYHLGRAIQLQWRLHGLEHKLFVQTQALHALSFGVLAVDGVANIYHANSQAEHILRRIAAMKVVQGRLRCGLASDQSRWERLLSSVTEHGISDGMRLRDAATLQEWLLWAVPAGERFGFSGKRMAVVVITDPNRPPSADMVLHRVFGFTPAETKLAKALAAGDTVADYSIREQISIATVRTHVRSILSKTGVDRQADFLRLVANAGVISAC